MSIIDDIKESFRQGDNLIKLIYVNLGVFLVFHIISTILYLIYKSDASFLLLNWLAVPAEISELITKPWTLLTYMFLHQEFMHILFNLITLYFGGRLFLEFLGEKRLVMTYLLGGLSGAFLYILFFNVFPAFDDILPSSKALGASASVLAIVVAIATYIPNFTVRLFFLFEVKLKYIAIVFVILDIVSISKSNPGGHIAHLGGAIFGYIMIKRYQKGVDWSNGFYRRLNAFGNLFKRKGKMKVAYKKGSASAKSSRTKDVVEQERIDGILDKISKSGYDSLTKEEKDLLFRASKD